MCRMFYCEGKWWPYFSLESYDMDFLLTVFKMKIREEYQQFRLILYEHNLTDN